MAHPVPQTRDAILDEAKAAIIHVSDVAPLRARIREAFSADRNSTPAIIHVADLFPLMKSKFALADDGDLDAMDAVEHRADGERRQVARPGRAA